MQTLNYDWGKFLTNNSWRTELDNVSAHVFEICHNIIKEISGHKNIKKLKLYSSFLNNTESKFEIEENNITLLKRSRSLCFCKWNEYIISETNINDIESIIFNKVYEDGKNKYYVICLKENSGFCWKYEIIV